MVVGVEVNVMNYASSLCQNRRQKLLPGLGLALLVVPYRELRPYQSAFLWHADRRSSRLSLP